MTPAPDAHTERPHLAGRKATPSRRAVVRQLTIAPRMQDKE